MSQILIGQSYFLRFDPKLWEGMQPYPPLGSMYAVSVLRQHGYEVGLFDAMLAESEEQWDEALCLMQPQYAILFEDNFNYLSKMCLLRMREAAYKMTAMARERGCIVILCGADATDHAEKYLAHGADYVLLGEGEQTLVELLDKLTGRSAASLDEILGLAYPDPAARNKGPLSIIRTPPRPGMKALDALPFPAWDLVDVNRYREIWMERHGYFSMNMVTTRGCPFHCNWCAKPIWGQRFISRSPENVTAETEWLIDTYKPDHLTFVDDIFGLKPGWLPRFAELIKAKGIHIPFKCLSRADLLTRPGEAEALRQAGAQTVWLGAESGSQKILDAMDKGTRIDQIQEAARLLKSEGIRTCFFLQFGYPGETWGDIQKTIQLVRDCEPDDIGISVSYPLPGTKFFEKVRAQLGDKQNWQDSSDLAMLYQGTYTTEFYRQLHTVLHKEFRARKAWQSLKRRLNLQHGARLLYNLISLPVARWKLKRMSAKPNSVLTLPHLPHEQAASPTPQE